jgi:hypothetical protein
MNISSLFGGAQASAAFAQSAGRSGEVEEQVANAPVSRFPTPEPQADDGAARRLVLQSSLIENLILHAKADASLKAFADSAPSSAAVAASYAEF